MMKTGESAVVPLLETFIEVAITAVREAVGGSSIGIFSNLSETDLTGFTGLQNILSNSTTTGTVGGNSRATNTWWRHQSADISDDFSVNGFNRMRTLFFQCSRGDENIDTIVLTRSQIENYERNATSSIQLNMPVTADQRLIDVGFENIKYRSAVILFDDGVPANRGYFLNFRKGYTQLVLHEDRMFEIGDFIRPSDGDYIVAHVFVGGNLVAWNLARQGVLLNGDTD